MSGEFTHPKLGEEVRAVGGGYTFLKESRLPIGDGEVIYFVGAAVYDTSCCGVGGCGYALVPGFLVNYKTKQDAGGDPVSVVEPIVDPALRQQITDRIKRDERVQEVQFWSTKEEGP